MSVKWDERDVETGFCSHCVTRTDHAKQVCNPILNGYCQCRMIERYIILSILLLYSRVTAISRGKQELQRV